MGKAGRRIFGGLVAAAALAAVTTGIPSTATAATPSSTGELSGPLAALATGGVARQVVPGSQVMRASGTADSSSTGPGSFVVTSDGVLVQVFSDHLTSSLERAIEHAGAHLVDSDPALGIATVSVAPSDLAGVAAVSGVRYVREVVQPYTSAASSLGVVQPACGAAHSEGDAELRAVDLRNAWDVEGAGVKVGLLSDSWNVAGGDATSGSQDIASGDIPGAANPCPGPGRTTAVTVQQEGPSTGFDEGRVMGQIVHDLAPAASIAFATGFTGDTAMAANIRALHNAGAKVIADDIVYFNEPAYQNGPIGRAVEDVVAGGSTYLSVIGNQTISLGGKPVSSYEAPSFRPTTCPAGIPGTCHDFDPSGGVDNTFGVTVPAGQKLQMTLKWNEPWNGVTTNLDLYFVVNGQVVASGTENNPTGTKQPYELASATAGATDVNVDVVVSQPTGTGTPRFRIDHIGSTISSSEYTQSAGGDVMGPSSVGHSAAPDGLGIAATRWSDGNAPESFSNRGPATWYWGPVSGTTAAAPLGAPLVLNKPDVTATDGGRTTFFFDRTSPYDQPRFYGTSAAAPHAAAVAALLLSCNSSLTPAQIGADLRQTAAPMPGGDPASVGAGMIDVLAAGNAVCHTPPPVPQLSVSDAEVTEGNGGVAAAHKLAFTVSLSIPATVAVSVTYATVAGTATSGTDYTALAATKVTFSAGQTSKVVNVTVKGDTAFESDEQLQLHLSKPIGVLIADADGVGTILNDDAAPVVPVVSVADVSGKEGNSAFASGKLTFTVTLSAPAPGNVSITYQTADGTAVAPGDYTKKAPTVLTFSKGQTSKTVTITLKGDAVHESDEILFLLLTKPVGMTIGDGSAIGTIVNDDA